MVKILMVHGFGTNATIFEAQTGTFLKNEVAVPYTAILFSTSHDFFTTLSPR